MYDKFTVIKQVIPILQWLPQYNSEKAISDVVAGITVGLTIIPQSIAYAVLAGLSPEVSTKLSIYKKKF